MDRNKLTIALDLETSALRRRINKIIRALQELEKALEDTDDLTE